MFLGLLAVVFLAMFESAHNAKLSDGWNNLGYLDNSTEVTAEIVFHQPAIGKAEKTLKDISNPQSKKFGQHLNCSALEKLFAPSELSQREVRRWLKQQAGIPPASVRLHKVSAKMSFNATIGQVNALLHANYYHAQNIYSYDKVIRTNHRSIPSELSDIVDFVSLRARRNGLELIKARSLPTLLASNLSVVSDVIHSSGPFDFRHCGWQWTPECIQELYGIPRESPRSASNHSLGIYGDTDIYSQPKLNSFWSLHAKFIKVGTGTAVKSIHGGLEASRQDSGEETLDLEMAMPIAYPTQVTVFQTTHEFWQDSHNEFDDLFDVFEEQYCNSEPRGDLPSARGHADEESVTGQADRGAFYPPNVLSISFGGREFDFGAQHARRQCYEWMKMALSGMTVVVASGDDGVAGRLGCLEGKGRRERFAPDFPASCPYVTSVGATQINFVGNDISEVAWDNLENERSSGGGFSDFMARPWYQKQVVKKYFAKNDLDLPTNVFNKGGRAYPDVALLGSNVADSYGDTAAEGTSASAPLFAAMVTRINDERMNSGKKPIGFLNAILYNHPEVFKDITEGWNPGCGTLGFGAANG